MDQSILEELEKRKEFAKQIKIESYDKVKEFLDEIAISTAKEAANGMVKLFEHLGQHK